MTTTQVMVESTEGCGYSGKENAEGGQSQREGKYCVHAVWRCERPRRRRKKETGPQQTGKEKGKEKNRDRGMVKNGGPPDAGEGYKAE